jgi:hypothetical protein
MYYVGQNDDLGARAEPIHQNGGSIFLGNKIYVYKWNTNLLPGEHGTKKIVPKEQKLKYGGKHYGSRKKFQLHV